MTVTPSASHLILCSRSLSLKIYALHNSQELSPSIKPVLLRTLRPHTTPVITAAIDSTGTLLATGSADGVVKIWDIRGGYVTHTFRGHAGVISALHFFEATDSELDSTATKNHKKKRRKSSGDHDEVMQDIMANGTTTNASFRLASGSEDGKIQIWNLAKRRSIAILDSHVSVVRDLDFLAEEDILVSGSRDKTVMLWDARTWKVKKVFPVLEVIEAVGFLNNGIFIYTGGENGKLRVWDAKSGNEVTQEQEPGNEGDGIGHICHNQAQDFLLCVHADQSLIIHSTHPLSDPVLPGHTIAPLPILRRISGTHDEIIDLAYVTPDRSLLALATNSEDIRLVSLASSPPTTDSLATAQYFGADVALLQGHEDIIICLFVDWSGCWLATGAKDNTARLWRIDHVQDSYTHYATFTGHAESLGAISLPSAPPPTGSAAHNHPLDHPPPFLLTGSQDRTIKRWNISSKKPTTTSKPSTTLHRALYTRKAHDKDINAISLSPTSHLFASASQDRTVKVWSVEEGEVLGILRGHRRGVWSVAFTPANYPAVTSDSGGSASRGLVLTGSGDKTVKIWNLTDYTCLRTLEGHTNSVLKILWMPPPASNRPPLLATAGGDGLVKLWDAHTGEPATTLDNHTDRVWALAVHPDTNTVVSGSADSTITFWKDTTSATAAASAQAATQRVEEEQKLQNHIRRGSYREAITLALQLNHPLRLLSLFQTVAATTPPEPDSLSGIRAVDDVLARLSDSQLLILLTRLRDWNTNVRTAGVAQRILGVVVRRYGAERLAGVRGAKGVVEGLRVWTERHYRRVEELVEESFVVGWVVGEMGALEVGGVGEGGVQDVVMV